MPDDSGTSWGYGPRDASLSFFCSSATPAHSRASNLQGDSRKVKNQAVIAARHAKSNAIGLNGAPADQRQKFLASLQVLAKGAQHGAGYRFGAMLLHAAHSHA